MCLAFTYFLLQIKWNNVAEDVAPIKTWYNMIIILQKSFYSYHSNYHSHQDIFIIYG